MAQLEQEYEQYRMEQIEIDPSQVLSFEEWYQSTYEASRQGVAEGGIARLGYQRGDLVHQFNNYAGDDGGNVSVPRTFQARTGSDPVNLAYITPEEQGILQSLKPGPPPRGPMEIPNYDSFDISGGYTSGRDIQDTGPQAGQAVGGGSTFSGSEEQKQKNLAALKRAKETEKQHMESGITPTGYKVTKEDIPEEVKESQKSPKEKYSDWYNTTLDAHYIKMKKKALAD